MTGLILIGYMIGKLSAGDIFLSLFSFLFPFFSPFLSSFPSPNGPNKREHCHIFTSWLVSFLIDGVDRIGWDGRLKLGSLPRSDEGCVNIDGGVNHNDTVNVLILAPVSVPGALVLIL